jgi:hypothetical protein
MSNRGLPGKEIESKAEREEFLKEEPAVNPVRALKKQRGERNLAVQHRSQPKKRTQGDGGSRKMLATAR